MNIKRVYRAPNFFPKKYRKIRLSSQAFKQFFTNYYKFPKVKTKSDMVLSKETYMDNQACCVLMNYL